MFTPALASLVSRLCSGSSLVHDDLIEVTTCWQDAVLSVTHLPWGVPLHLADSTTHARSSATIGGRLGAWRRHHHLALPAEAIGHASWKLLSLDGDAVVLHPCPHMRVWHHCDADEPKERALPRETPVALERNQTIRLEMAELDLVVRRVPAEQCPAGLWSSNWHAATWLSFLGCASIAAGFMVSAAYFSPPLHLGNDESLEHARFLAISQYLESASERERDRKEDHALQREEPADSPGRAAERALGQEGALGQVTTQKTMGRVGTRGPTESSALSLRERQRMFEDATTGGFIGMLRASSLSEGHFSPFGSQLELGSDARSAQGLMFGNTIDDAVGAGGLGLSSEGSGGGTLFGKGLGRQLSGLATIGGGSDHGDGGANRGLSGRRQEPRSPRIRPAGVTETGGRLPPQAVQRVIRQNFGRFRLCYEQGLARNPNLTGRVSVRFLIGSDGAVASAQGSGDLPDAGVVNCVTNAFYGLSFPQPRGNTVRVNYPLLFSPT